MANHRIAVRIRLRPFKIGFFFVVNFGIPFTEAFNEIISKIYNLKTNSDNFPMANINEIEQEGMKN